MGLAINNLAPASEDRASGGQVIDGSLRFDSGSSHYLNRTPGSAGNRRTWTWSGWVKRASIGVFDGLFGAQNGTDVTQIRINSGNSLMIAFFEDGSYYAYVTSSAIMRDHSAWYHCVAIVDSTASTSTDRMILYLNGVKQTAGAEITLSQNYDTAINSTVQHNLGANRWNSGQLNYLNGNLTEVNFIDGQALDASYFGFTDPLTNTWRPKKFDISKTPGGSWGTNGFYLPMDGNSLIGQDKSSNGNNFTPVNFGGSMDITKATGALPILNTVNGGTTAGVGFRTDTAPGNGPVGVSTYLVLAIPMVGVSSDVSNQINNGSTQKIVTNNGTVTGVSSSGNFYGESFYFGGSNNYLSFNSSSDLAFGTGPYTVEMWVNPFALPSGGILFSNSSNNGFVTNIDTGGIAINQYAVGDKVATTEGIPLNQWSHLAFVREGTGTDQAKIYVNGVVRATGTDATDWTVTTNPGFGANIAHGGQPINALAQDLRVYKGVAKYTSEFIPASTDPDILPDTPSGVAGGSALTLTPNSDTEGAVTFDGVDDYLRIDRGTNTDFEFGTGDFTIEFWAYIMGSDDDVVLSTVDNGSYTTGGWVFESNQQFRISNSSGTYETWGTFTYPVKKWIHVAVSRSGSTGYGFIDGIQQFSFSTSIDNGFGGTNDLSIGSRTTTTNLRSQVISNLRIIKGTGLYTSNFTPSTTPLTNVTNTVLLCCQSNTSATAAAVTPSAIESNGGASATTFSPFLKENINTIRGQETSYPTLNPLFQQANVVLSNGNLDFTVSANSSAKVGATIGIPTSQGGKYYWEVTQTSRRRVAAGVVNVVGTGYTFDNSNDIGATSNEWGVRFSNSSTQGAGTAMSKAHNSVVADHGSFALENGGTLQIALDLDNTSIWFGGDGSWMGGDPEANSGATYTNLTGEIVPFVQRQTGTSGCKINFGQKPFKYAPPEGFKPITLANLPRPTKAAVRPDKYFNTVLWTGNATNRDIDVGFQPDFVWIKHRNSAENHNLYDVIRGATKRLESNSQDSEQTYADRLTSFNSNGFSLGTGYNNTSSTTYVGWCWKAGGTPVSNTDGSITSSVSANQNAGFSIVTWTGSQADGTVGHGLDKAPSLIIFKRYSYNGTSWPVYHSAIGPSNFVALNEDSDSSSSGTLFGSTPTAPTSTVFSVGNNGGSNYDSMIAYCWSEVPGFSKFGSYTGNGSSDGTFVATSFAPAWLLIKRTDTSGYNWTLFDSERRTYNVNNHSLNPNNSNTEETSGGNGTFDFLSNGFKARNTDGGVNASGGTYIFMAFAEAPTNNLFGGQANAR